MIDADALAAARFDVTLAADAAARLTPPPEMDDEIWWQIGDATWLRALPHRSVQIREPGEGQSTTVRFRRDGPGLEADRDADPVWAADAVKGLAAELVEGLLRQLDASVPALPSRAPPLPPAEPQLDWPGGAPGRPEARRRRRLAASAALSDYLGRVGQGEAGTVPAGASARDLSERLIRHLSAIPRPAETRLSLSSEAGGGPVLSWTQPGNPELLWGAAEVCWNGMSRSVGVARLPPGQADEKCRLGAWAHLLAMATAVEAATGGVAVPLRLHFGTEGDRPVTATFTILPSHWGFDLPRLVQAAGQGRVPEAFRFCIKG